MLLKSVLQTRLFYTVKAAGDLATQAARSSATMVLSMFSRNIPISVPGKLTTISLFNRWVLDVCLLGNLDSVLSKKRMFYLQNSNFCCRIYSIKKEVQLGVSYELNN